MIVEVKQKHIDEGIQKKANCCAISQAIKEKFNTNADIVTTGYSSCHVVAKRGNKNFESMEYAIPPCAGEFIIKFDHDKKSVKPFTFTMRPTNDIYRRQLKKEKQNARKRHTNQ